MQNKKTNSLQIENQKNNKKFINVDGNTATSLIAYYLSEVAEIYPITPSSVMAETCDELAEKGKKNIFGNKLLIREMQSEAGAAGALHGSLLTGALSTTFTASQGLLLMIPNMFKIAGELLPTVFHISARAIATHALSIFGDHSDVMATRSTGFNMLCSNSVQEAHDLALVAHIASIKSSLPFLHFFDGFRTSHEVQKIEAIDEEKIKQIFPFDLVAEFKKRALNPLSPTQKGTAQNPDIFFQNREACNKFYNNAYSAVEDAMNAVYTITGRQYKPFEYFGSETAESVIIMMGSGAETAEETIEFLNQNGANLGLVKVRLYRPFNAKALANIIPKSVKKIAVLDRTKESGSVGEPLFVDVVSSLVNQNRGDIKVVGGRYGLGSKEFTPSCVKAVFDNLQDKMLTNFTVGIEDDVTHLSLELKDFEINKTFERSFKFYGLGSDGTVSANKNSIKIIGELTNLYTQGFFEYDSKKSGSITISHLRVSKNPIKSTYVVTSPELIAIHNYSFVARYNLLENLASGGIVLLNTTLNSEQLSTDLPLHFVQNLKKKNAQLFVIDASKIAIECGLGNKINVVMQSAFFKITQIVDEEKIVQHLKDAVVKSYGHKGQKVIDANFSAIDKGMQEIHNIDISALVGCDYSQSKKTNDTYYKNYIEPINKLEGNKLPVSAFSPDGTIPTGTTQFEKRGIASQCPEWIKENCIQCGMCVLSCPHAALRGNLLDDKTLKSMPQHFQDSAAKAMGIEGKNYKLQLSPLDCTGCGVCANVCPARNKALKMVTTTDILEKEKQNWQAAKALPPLAKDENPFPLSTAKGLQFEEPFFEFNYACAGCGETPYIRLATTLFGENMLIANATGCSSIYGGSAPASPYTKNQEGCGPAWANSLFEDNAEFGLGFKLGVDSQKQLLKNNIEHLVKLDSQKQIKLSDKTKKLLNEWLEKTNETSNQNCKEICSELAKDIEKKENSKAVETIQKILDSKDYLFKKSIWIIGGDGWAYDIGFGGLDHILASNEDVNILVLDSEVYSNTGGQSSKSTPTGAFAKFAIGGKTTSKKDLGAIAMTYPHVYVASVALGANQIQCIKAFSEAEKHKGPSLILAYSPCINHGFDMSTSQEEMKKAVESGYWFLYRRNPDEEKPFHLDSIAPTKSYEEFLLGESRYASIHRKNPQLAKQLFEESQKDAISRFNKLKSIEESQKNN